MKPDFYNAHQRHLKDAELLFAEQRLANADLLFGQAAECGLKYLMRQLGMPITAAGDPESKADKVHVDQLWSRFTIYHERTTSGILFSHLTKSNPFHNWRISHRYANEIDFEYSKVEAHLAGARLVDRAILEAKKAGWAL